GQALERNRGAVAQLAAIAAARGMTASQAAIAWVRATRPNDVPLIGARTEAQLEDALGALAHPLSPAEAAELGAVIGPAAIAGERYPAPQLAHIARS
ncbi:MAG TPA: aldo/keto reductase, partial [Kofleriaceae bacterium]|nr:aldo/keto reductase [Kofleriaceae bacterium]